jgi:hypothetical protein
MSMASMGKSELLLGEGARDSEARGLWRRPLAPPPNNLLLLGTVHGDPRGYVRAWRLLKHLRPTLITVEISPFSVRCRLREGPRWQRLLHRALGELPPGAGEHPAIRRLAAQVALPFEYRVARDYSRHYAVSLKALDLGGPSRRHLPRYARELLTSDNLRALAATPGCSLEEWVEAEFHRARQAGARPPWRLAFQSPPDTLRREQLMARRLRKLIRQGWRVAHLGGWEHLLSWRDGDSFLQLLTDLKPAQLLLDEADLLPPAN